MTGGAPVRHLAIGLALVVGLAGLGFGVAREKGVAAADGAARVEAATLARAARTEAADRAVAEDEAATVSGERRAHAAAAEVAARAAAEAARVVAEQAQAALQSAADAAAASAANDEAATAAAAAQAGAPATPRVAEPAPPAPPAPATPAAPAPVGPPVFITSVPTADGDGSNGNMPASAMCLIPWGTDQLGSPQYLRCDAADALTRLNDAFRAQFGEPIAMDLTYRSYADQVAIRAYYGALAARPGTSSHGLGRALDVQEWPDVYGFGTPRYDWLVATGPTFGWVAPASVRETAGYPEYWHFEYNP